MKKKIILSSILAGMFSLNVAQAQTENTTTTTTTTTEMTAVSDKAETKGEFAKLYIGVRYLPTVTKFKVNSIGNGLTETSAVIGYGVGGYLGTNLSRNVGLQVEVLYNALSQKYKQNNVEKKIDLTYVNIPLLLVLNSDVSKMVNLNVCVGPQIGINTGSKIKSEGSDAVDTVSAVIAVKPADLGFAYGIGLDFRIAPPLTLGLGFRGVYGLLDVSDNSKSVTTNQYYILDRAHISTYSLYAGLALNF